MDKIDQFYKFIDNPASAIDKKDELLNMFLTSNLIAYKMIITAIEKDQMKQIIYNYDKTECFRRLSELLSEQLRQINIEQHKIDICVNKLKYLINKFKQTGKFVGQEIFKDIVKMAHEANMKDIIKKKLRKYLTFKKIPLLIESEPIRPIITDTHFLVMTKGVDLTLYMYENAIVKLSDETICNFYLYKPMPNIYVLRIEFKLLISNHPHTYDEYASQYTFDYEIEPTPETLIEWTLDTISKLFMEDVSYEDNIIRQKFVDNDAIINLFKRKIKVNKEEEKRTGLDQIRFDWWSTNLLWPIM